MSKPSEPISNKNSKGDQLNSLWSRSLSGGAFTLGSKVIKLLLIIISYAALGRLLSPLEFGLVNMVTPFIFFTMIFADMGFSTAVIQRKDISDYETSTMFWMSIITGSFFTFLSLVAIVPLFAYVIYDEPRIVSLAILLSMEIILFSVRSQYNAIMNRNMQFNAIAVIQLLGSVVSTIVAIVTALNGFGAWALVWMRLTQGLFETVCYIGWVRWMPQFVSLRDLPTEMLKFGLHLTGYRTADFSNRSMHSVLIGAVLGPIALGPYAVANRLMRLPIDEFIQALSRIATTSLSRLQDDHHEFEVFYCRMLRIILLIGGPAIAFAAVMAEPIVVLFLGEQWISAAPIFSFLAIASISQLLTSTIGWTQISTARTDRIFRWSVYMLPITLASFVIGHYWGAIGVAAAYGFISMVMTVPTFAYALKTSPVSSDAVWKAVVPGLATTIVVAGVLGIFSLNTPEFADSLGGLFVGGLIAGVIYIAALFLVIGPEEISKFLAKSGIRLPGLS